MKLFNFVIFISPLDLTRIYSANIIPNLNLT